MTDYPQPPQNENQPGPFASPLVAEVRDETSSESIQHESLSLGGRLAWLVIAAVVASMIILTAVFRSGEESRTEATSSDLFPVQLEARSHVGQRNIFGAQSRKKASNADADDADPAGADSADADSAEADSAEELQEDEESSSSSSLPIPETLNDGTYEQRLCYVLLVNETEGADAAAETLTELDEAAEDADFELSENQSRLRSIVGDLIEDYQQGDFDAESVSESDRDFLKEKLGWVGELGLVPAGTRDTETRKELIAGATWSMGLMMSAALMMLLMLVAGVAIAALLAVFFATGKLKAKFSTRGRSVNVYVETFAIWLVFFFGGPRLIGLLFGFFEYEPSITVSLLIQVGFFFGSLIVLVYPWLRGIPLAQLFDDIGWKMKGGLKDVLVAPLHYVAGTPLMFCGLICVMILTFIATMFTGPRPFGTSIAAGHPIQEIVAGGQWWSVFYIVLMACIAAPIVEETMFRGVLYRHLRELSGDWARWGSVIFSAVFNGLIFAAIHPQGVTAIPLLTMLAINFSLAREWRDSLIAPILMHAINNSAVTFFMFMMM